MTIDEIYESIKKETCVKSYKIEKEKADNLTIYDSKFGGIPYWDFSKEFPTNSKGEKLNLLAQINFDKENFNSIVVRILKDKFNVIIEENEVGDYLKKINEKYYEKFETWGHKLLGYPACTQSDPRCYNKKYSKYDTLLLQIDTDSDIMWGDSGVANFFISKEDMKNKKFDNILYNWDCC